MIDLANLIFKFTRILLHDCNILNTSLHDLNIDGMSNMYRISFIYIYINHKLSLFKGLMICGENAVIKNILCIVLVNSIVVFIVLEIVSHTPFLNIFSSTSNFQKFNLNFKFS